MALVVLAAGGLAGCTSLAPTRCYVTLSPEGRPTAEACENEASVRVRPLDAENGPFYAPPYVLGALAYEGFIEPDPSVAAVAPPVGDEATLPVATLTGEGAGVEGGALEATAAAEPRLGVGRTWRAFWEGVAAELALLVRDRPPGEARTVAVPLPVSAFAEAPADDAIEARWPLQPRLGRAAADPPPVAAVFMTRYASEARIDREVVFSLAVDPPSAPYWGINGY